MINPLTSAAKGGLLGAVLLLGACDTANLGALHERAANPQTLAGLYLKLRAEQEIRDFIQAHSPELNGLDDGDLVLLQDACDRLTEKRALDTLSCAAVWAEGMRRGSFQQES